MNRRLSTLGGLLALLLVLLLPSRGLAIEGLPGSTWGEASHDVDSLVGSGAMGYVNQGVDWIVLPGGVAFNTYAEFRYRLRSRNNDFYNAYGPLVGAELRKWIFKAGVDYIWERFPNLSETDNKFQYYLRWYDAWDLKNAVPTLKTLPVAGLSGSIWGELSHDVDSLVGNGAIGYLNQRVDWIVLPGHITLNTFAEFRYRLRSRNNDFYNAYGPAIGVELRQSVFRLGADYFWERYPGLNETDSKVQFYLTWFVDWDLMRLKK